MGSKAGSLPFALAAAPAGRAASTAVPCDTASILPERIREAGMGAGQECMRTARLAAVSRPLPAAAAAPRRRRGGGAGLAPHTPLSTPPPPAGRQQAGEHAPRWRSAPLPLGLMTCVKLHLHTHPRCCSRGHRCLLAACSRCPLARRRGWPGLRRPPSPSCPPESTLRARAAGATRPAWSPPAAWSAPPARCPSCRRRQQACSAGPAPARGLRQQERQGWRQGRQQQAHTAVTLAAAVCPACPGCQQAPGPGGVCGDSSRAGGCPRTAAHLRV